VTGQHRTVAPRGPDLDDRVRRTEILISRVLRTGVVLSLTLIVLGTFLSFIHHPEYISSPDALLRLTHPSGAVPHTLSDVLSGLRDLRGQAVVALGLLLLIATPVLRVAVSIVAFTRQGDRIFTFITAVVLGILLLSFALGAAE
jgi:uncharacterized membrane protein